MRLGCLRWGLVGLIAGQAAVAADETRTVYRAVGAHGVVEFSDTAVPGAQAIELPVNEPSPEALAANAERLAQELELIAFLEDSRREREARSRERRLDELELARARADLERARQPVEEEPRYRAVHYPGAWWMGKPWRPPFVHHPHRPGGPHRPDKPDEPRPEPVIHKPLPAKR